MNQALDKKEVLELAGLARLELSDDQVTAMASELSKILGVFQSLDGIDVTRPGESEANAAPATPLREDRVHASLEPSALETSAPQWDDNLFVVPKIVSKDSP